MYKEKYEPITTIKSILFYRAKGLSSREIAEKCHCSRLTVVKYLKMQKTKSNKEFMEYLTNLITNKKISILKEEK